VPESVLPLFIEHPGPYLQQKVRPTLTPAHLLLLHHPFAHHLIDRRLDEPRSDLFPVAIAFPIIWDEGLVTLDVTVQVLDAFQEFLGAVVLALEG